MPDAPRHEKRHVRLAGHLAAPHPVLAPEQPRHDRRAQAHVVSADIGTDTRTREGALGARGAACPLRSACCAVVALATGGRCLALMVMPVLHGPNGLGRRRRVHVLHRSNEAAAEQGQHLGGGPRLRRGVARVIRPGVESHARAHVPIMPPDVGGCESHHPPAPARRRPPHRRSAVHRRRPRRSRVRAAPRLRAGARRRATLP